MLTTTSNLTRSPGEELGAIAREIARRYAPQNAPDAAPCFPAHDGRYVLIEEAKDLGVIRVQIDAIPINLVVLDGGVVKRLHDPEYSPLRTDKLSDISDPATPAEVAQALDYLKLIP